MEIKITADEIRAPIRSLLTLVRCTGHIWPAKKRVPQVAAKAETDNGARHGSVQATKFLFPGCDKEYRAVCSAVRKALSDSKDMTAPWRADKSGYRALPNDEVFNYMQMMAKHKANIIEKRTAFKDIYAQRMHEAVSNLGTLGNPQDYISPSEIDTRFDIEFWFEPVSLGDDFGSLPKGVDTVLAQKLNEHNAMKLGAVMTYCLQELRGHLDHMQETLSDEENDKWKSSLITNVERAITLASGFNLKDDQRWEDILMAAERCTDHDMKTLKSDVEIRRATVKAAQTAINAIDGYAAL